MIAIEDRVLGIEIDDVTVHQIEPIGDLMPVIDLTTAEPLKCGGMGAAQREN